MPSVVQEWVSRLSMMQQTVLLTCIRGCDGLPKRHASKFLLRWYRRSILLSAFDNAVLHTPHDQRGGNFTGPIPAHSTLADIADEYLASVDETPHHFQMHLIHAAEILGYKHPDVENRAWWNQFYLRAVRDFHLLPETEEHLDKRLGDSQAQWQEAGGEHLTDR